MPDIKYPGLGERIKKIRLSLGLNLEEFGLKFSPTANKSNVSRWEKDKAIPTPERLNKIAELGNVTVEYLLTGNDFSNIFNEQSLLDFRQENIELLSEQLSNLTTIENTQENLVTEENFRYFIPILIFLNKNKELDSLRLLRNNILKLSEVYQEYIFYDKFNYTENSEKFDMLEYIDYKNNPTLKNKEQTIQDFNKLKQDLVDELEEAFELKLKKLHKE